MSREAMQLALEALETNNKAWKHLADSGDAGFWEAEEQPFYELSIKAITAMRQALETEQEPVAWYCNEGLSRGVSLRQETLQWKPLYTAPPKRDLTCVCGAVWEGETMVHSPREREWVGLTDEEHDGIKNNYHNMAWTLEMFARAVEAKLKDKNA